MATKAGGGAACGATTTASAPPLQQSGRRGSAVEEGLGRARAGHSGSCPSLPWACHCPQRTSRPQHPGTLAVLHRTRAGGSPLGCIVCNHPPLRNTRPLPELGPRLGSSNPVAPAVFSPAALLIMPRCERGGAVGRIAFPASHPDKRPGTHVSGEPQWEQREDPAPASEATRAAGRPCLLLTRTN